MKDSFDNDILKYSQKKKIFYSVGEDMNDEKKGGGARVVIGEKCQTRHLKLISSI